MEEIFESTLEEATLEWWKNIGYVVLHGPDISPDGESPERRSYNQVALEDRLKKALSLAFPYRPQLLVSNLSTAPKMGFSHRPTVTGTYLRDE